MVFVTRGRLAMAGVGAVHEEVLPCGLEHGLDRHQPLSFPCAGPFSLNLFVKPLEVHFRVRPRSGSRSRSHPSWPLDERKVSHASYCC